MAEDSYLHRILENYDETVDLKKEIEQHVKTAGRYMATVSQMVQQLADKDAEIVRLRAAGDALAEVAALAIPWITPMAALAHRPRLRDAIAAWQEARRG